MHRSHVRTSRASQTALTLNCSNTHATCPPGKTLIARQIGKMLAGKEPKVVNGPEILNKFVGASEENIRKLFADAEADYAANKENSELHIIIFDEIDAVRN